MYDLIVIGGGPGGYLAAERAAHAGLRTLLFEKNALGGVCLNEGCVPSKTLLQSAKTFEHALHAEKYGVLARNVSIDQNAVIRRKNKVVRSLVAGVSAKLRAAGVTVVAEHAVLAGRQEGGFAVKAAQQTYVGKHIILATGSSAVVPPIPGVAENLGTFVLTNREILDLTTIPAKLTVIGGGVIGLEMAAYYATVGSQVTVVEMLPKIAGATDGEISAFLQKELEKKGVRFLLEHKCLSVAPGRVIAEGKNGQVEVEADKVLLSIGRRANTEGLGLETVGVEYTKAGIPTDAMGRTNVPGIFAVGDVNGHHMLAHTAYREAEVAVNHMLGKTDEMRYDVIPSVIYTDPEVASVGLSAEAAKSRGMNVKEIKLPMIYAGRYVAEVENGDGFIKLVVDTDRNRLVGCHMVGSYASEIIMTATMMVDTELTPSRLQKMVFPHPTVAEVIREALFKI
jgi:dihydrolipoamide dehydrogenase